MFIYFSTYRRVTRFLILMKNLKPLEPQNVKYYCDILIIFESPKMKVLVNIFVFYVFCCTTL